MSRRILILFPGSLGDFLCVLPALQFLRAAIPESSIEIAARGDGLLLAQRLPDVTRTVSLESSIFTRLYSPHPSLNSQEKHFFASTDEIVSWFGHTRPEVRETLQEISAGRLRSFPFFTGQEVCHATTYYLRCLGGTELLCPSLVIGHEEKHWLDTYWQQRGWDARSRILVLHPGSGGKKKRWSAEGFIRVAQWWASHRNKKVLILLGPAEEGEAQAWRQVGEVESALSVWQAAALLSRTDLYLGNDSGVSHLAGAVGAHGIVLFGPTHPQQWRPLGGSLSVVRNLPYRTEHPDEAGMTLTEIPVEEVITALSLLGV